ncbi:MAG: acyl carrier protein [Planctomycetota bacterium]
MNEETIQERVKEIMAGVFSMRLTHVGTDSSIDTVEQWDSLQHINLMMALEQEFGIRIDVEDAVEMTSLRLVCERLARYLGGAE